MTQVKPIPEIIGQVHNLKPGHYKDAGSLHLRIGVSSGSENLYTGQRNLYTDPW